MGLSIFLKARWDIVIIPNGKMVRHVAKRFVTCTTSAQPIHMGETHLLKWVSLVGLTHVSSCAQLVVH
jgi:hypothetical protein